MDSTIKIKLYFFLLVLISLNDLHANDYLSEYYTKE